jgi:hypothetical protein
MRFIVLLGGDIKFTIIPTARGPHITINVVTR